MWAGYPHGHLDEVFDRTGNVRPVYQSLLAALERIGPEGLDSRERIAQQTFQSLGVTFVTGSNVRIDRPIPVDIVPRIISHEHWRHIERGIKQRTYALNMLVADIYGDQTILRAGVIPRDFVYSSPLLEPRMMGQQVPANVWTAVVGSDLVRTDEAQYAVLEDNVRGPSGVSYVMENRLIFSRSWPQQIRHHHVMPVSDYPQRLLETFLAIRPGKWVVWTPGVYNSAYFEHSLLANQMGLELVEGRDLLVWRNQLHLRTTNGLKPVEGIYRRLDESFLDPLAFRPDSLIGVPGLVNLLAHGQLAMVNAMGVGVVDDKGIYRYVPDAIKFYLGEDPILDNIPTYTPTIAREYSHMVAHWDDMVIKPVSESGGKGIYFGRDMDAAEREYWQNQLRAFPRQYIGQPVIEFSQAPCFVGGRMQPRYVDLRPFCLLGQEAWVLPGGLTRVSKSDDSCVVNSSQGGGTKDTWVERRMTGGSDHA